jgi:hypothetical protein
MPTIPRRGPTAATLTLLALALAGGRSLRAAEPDGLVWRSVAVPVRGGEISALGFDRASARLAIGDLRGVLVGPTGGPFERRLRRGPVRDLAFAAGGALLAGTDRGLFLIAPEGGLLEVSPGPGAAARGVSRLAVAGEWLAAATADGVFVSRDARRWQRLGTALPAGAATALALRERADELECWAVIDGEPWSARLDLRAPALAARASQREVVAFAAADGGPVDVVLDPPGADVALVYPSALALRAAPSADWRILRLALPPGADAQRLTAAAGRLFLATSRGLLVANALGSDWRRATPPAGSAAVQALAGDARAVYAAADAGLLAAEAGAAFASAAAGAARPLVWREEPGVEQVLRAALAYLRLGPGRLEGLVRGAARRGWLPIVAVHGVMARDHSRATAWDQVVSAGSVASLVDRDRDRQQDYDLGVTLSWDLGDVAYHPEQIDISREAREVIELRDDVLDEITQLYFERRRMLVDLESLPDPDGAEALRLRLRADELAAGIDAWTGGWFGRSAPPLVP